MEIERNYGMFADYSIFVCAVAVEPTCVVLFLDFPLSPLLFASLALFMVQFKVGHPHSGKLKRNAKLVKKKYWVEVQSSKTSQLLSMHRYFLFSVMFSSFPLTRSYAALWAADLDWIVGPGYSSGGYILKKNHEKP